MIKEEVIEKIGKDNWKDFTDFMYGQTVGIINDKPDYYKWDVEKYMEMIK